MTLTPSRPISPAPITVPVGSRTTPLSPSPLQGLLAAQVRYVARLAHGMDPRLELGPLRALTTDGTSPLTALVSFDEGGECRMRGHVLPSPSPATPADLTGAHRATLPLAGGMQDGADARVEACLRAVHDLPGLQWGALVGPDRSVVASVGAPVADALPDVAVRALGILTGLEEQRRETCVWLTFEHSSLLVAPLESACLVLCLPPGGDDTVVATLHAVRRTLSGLDLDRVTPLSAPYRPAVEEVGAPDDEWDDGWDDEESWDDDVPLIGARFAGAVGSVPREGRRRQSRWLSRNGAS